MSAARISSSQNSSSGKRLNLLLAGLLAFYIVFTIWLAVPHVECGRIGGDYCQYLGGGRVANAYGYAHIYDLQLPRQAQGGNLSPATDSSPTWVLPFPYLPVFVLPFQLFSLLTPDLAFWTWTAANLAALFLYLRSFLRRLDLQPAPKRLWLMIFVSLPVYMNLMNGQVNVWLVVCVGEFMIALFNRQPFRAGLWLGGLLLKPQLLILIGLLLLVRRSWQILAGLAASSGVLAIVSTLMIGPSGLVQMLKIWIGTANAPTGIWVEGMMNWRMLGLHLSNISNPWIGWGFAGLGTLATLIVTLYVWRQPFDSLSPSFPIALLGILAATSMITWFAHIHEAVFLIPPLVYLYQARQLPNKVLDWWVFFPASMFVAMVFVPETLMKLGILPDGRPLIYFLIGMSEFSANACLLSWAVVASHRSYRPGVVAPSSGSAFRTVGEADSDRPRI